VYIGRKMHNIQEVLQQLKQIMDWAIREQSPAGYFAALYYRMTAAVAEGIRSGAFEDGPRMERLDVVFASRYVDAFHQWQNGLPCTRAWSVAFDAFSDPQLTVMQHLMLGVNAHINLDLGVAAAVIAPEGEITALKGDFFKINAVISSLVDQTQQQLADIWLPFSLLDWLLKDRDENWINFSIGRARDSAWAQANLFAALPPQSPVWESTLHTSDQSVAWLADRIRRPGRLMQLGLWCMRRSESGSVADKIRILQSTTFS
jgi:hypothetical protein